MTTCPPTCARSARLATQRAVVATSAALFTVALTPAAFAAPAQPAAPTYATTHTVVMKATSYAPLSLTVKHGDTVVWVNEDPFPHTVTAAGAFDSKSIPAGASWEYKPPRAGEYAYTCTFHPNMKGTLTVQEAAPQTRESP